MEKNLDNQPAFKRPQNRFLKNKRKQMLKGNQHRSDKNEQGLSVSGNKVIECPTPWSNSNPVTFGSGDANTRVLDPISDIDNLKRDIESLTLQNQELKESLEELNRGQDELKGNFEELSKTVKLLSNQFKEKEDTIEKIKEENQNTLKEMRSEQIKTAKELETNFLAKVKNVETNPEKEEIIKQLKSTIKLLQTNLRDKCDKVESLEKQNAALQQQQTPRRFNDDESVAMDKTDQNELISNQQEMTLNSNVINDSSSPLASTSIVASNVNSENPTESGLVMFPKTSRDAAIEQMNALTMSSRRQKDKYACDVCQQAFNLKSNAIAHLKKVHIDTEKNIRCPYCSKFRTNYQSALKNHLRTHNKPKKS